MNKKIIVLFVIIVLGGLGILLLTKSGTLVVQTETTTSETQTTTATDTTSTSTPLYTLADVAAHKDATSCWTTISGKVYDLTSFVGRHPGGENAILSICGKDGSSAFMDQHGGQRRPEQELAKLFIGTLK